ncbi:MAG: hypothetical protein ACFB20_06450 [Opitutales bacterium]
MTRWIDRRLTGLLLVCLPGLAWGQAQVPAFFFADRTAPVAARLAPTSPALEDATPVEGLEGWESIEYEATFEGFVDPLAIRADNTVAPATLIYSSDAPDSTVLAESDPSVAVEIVDRGPLWSKIRTTQPVTLFVPVGGATAAAATQGASGNQAATQTLDPSNEGAPTAGFQEPTPLDGTGVNVAVEDGLAPGSPASDLQPIDDPANAAAPAAPAPVPVIVDDPGEPRAQPASSTVRPVAPTATLSRPFFGILKKRAGFFGRSKGPKYGLYSRDGELLARVDLSTALVFGSIDGYLNRPVVLQGVPIPESGRPGVRIQARTLHLN